MTLNITGSGVVYTNDYYIVSVEDSVGAGTVETEGAEYKVFYIATNTVTGVVELKHPSLPVILHNVERWSMDLENESYLWARQSGDYSEDEYGEEGLLDVEVELEEEPQKH